MFASQEALSPNQGDPHGYFPAVYISNYYLHTYEFDFLQQLIPMQAAGLGRLCILQPLGASCWQGMSHLEGQQMSAALVLRQLYLHCAVP
jgi:hypothetical protein